jgi:hypothetical protein
MHIAHMSVSSHSVIFVWVLFILVPFVRFSSSCGPLLEVNVDQDSGNIILAILLHCIRTWD